MPFSELGEAEAANREAWEILRQRKETLKAWAEQPPQTIGEADRPIVGMLAKLSLHALWTPHATDDAAGSLGRLHADESK